MLFTKRSIIYAGVVVLISLAALFVVYRLRSPWRTLLSFQNQDLQNLPDNARRSVQRAIDKITGGPATPNLCCFIPSFFTTMTNTKGQTRYILVEEAPLEVIPGEATIRTHTFDHAGTLLAKNEFSGGWRTIVTRIYVAKNSLIHQDALVVDGQYWVGSRLSHHYFVLDGDRIVPAYFESDGTLNREEYLQTNLSVAPSVQ